MAFNIREISNLSEAKLTELSVLAAAAFEGDGFLLAAVGNDPTLNVSYHRAQMIAATMAGKIVVAEDAQDESVIGVALWFPPGITMFASEDQDRIALGGMTTFWWNTPSRAKECLDGIGSTTLGNLNYWRLRQVIKARALDLPLFVMKEQNVRFYQRLGFVLRGKYEFNSNSGGFPLFCMTAARYTL
ncbi:hypothetical protein AB1N83_004747 [Pleurotus pulmonarius]